MTPIGSHHASVPRKKTPAQKANAYAALKLDGIKSGIRDNANVATKITDRIILPFIKTILARTAADSNRENATPNIGSSGVGYHHLISIGAK